MAYWLKMIGTKENPWPVGRLYEWNHIGFRGRKPSGIRPGDRMVLYAVGGSKRIFALVEVTSKYYGNDGEGWPYRVNIGWPLEVNLAPSDGVDVDEVSEHLKFSLRQHSHIKLTLEEYERASAKLREALSSE